MREIHKNLYQFLSIIIAHVKSSGVSQVLKTPDGTTNAATNSRPQQDVNLTPTQSANQRDHEGEENLVDAEDSTFLHDSVQNFFTEYLDSLRHGSLSAPSDSPQAHSPSFSNEPGITIAEEKPNMNSNASSVQTLQRSDLSSEISSSQNSSGCSLDRFTSTNSQSSRSSGEEGPSISEANKNGNIEDGASIKKKTAQVDLQSQTKDTKLLEGVNKDEHPVGGDPINLEKRNEFDQTPLMLAASSGKVDVVKSLVQHGANVEAKDREGATALHVAIERARWPVVSFLLQPETHKVNEITKIDVNSSDNLGRTPLHSCARLNCSEKDITIAIQQLLHLGADINMRDKADHTPLYYAIKCPPKHTVIEVLLQNSTDIDFEWPIDTPPRIKDVLEKYRDARVSKPTLKSN